MPQCILKLVFEQTEKPIVNRIPAIINELNIAFFFRVMAYIRNIKKLIAAIRMASKPKMAASNREVMSRRMANANKIPLNVATDLSIFI